jgi:predicted DNA-binding transcriptional regulator YafY
MQPIPSLAMLPPNSAPGEIQVAVFILKALEAAATLDFAYYGGSHPSERRRVRPVLLFQKIHPEEKRETASPAPLYLLAWCLTRQSTRTFRLDRMALDSPFQFSV